MTLFRLLLPTLVVGCWLTAFRQDTPSPAEAPDEHRFRKIDLTGNLPDLIALDIAANGDVYFVGHAGQVYRYRAATRATETIGKVAAQISEATLQAIALDPGFARNKHLYLYYAPQSAKNINRLARFTLRGDSLDLASEKTLLEIPDSWECCHSGGSMTFDRHGNLYLTTGDNTNPFGTNYSPSDERPGRERNDAQRSAGNTRDLRGKILRIHPEPDGTYTIPEGNLFPDQRDSLTRPEIYVMGCRNPFQVTVDRETDFVYWSEIGPDASDKGPHGPAGYDELNQARRAGNHGWPLFIGNNEPYAKVDFATDSVLFYFDPQKPVNTSPNNTGRQFLPPAQPALLWYPYDVSPDHPELGAGGRTLVAGPIYYFDPKNPSPIKFPAYFDRKLFLGEWMRNWMKVVSFDDQKQIRTIEPFMPSTRFRKPISMRFGPDGALYLLEFGALWGNNRDSRLTRIEYIAGNRPPLAKLEASAEAGAAPLTVQLSAKNSTDHDPGDQLTYRWLVNGKALPQRTADLAYTFRKPGTYQLKLIVSDRAGAHTEVTRPIQVGNSPPVVAIELGEPGHLYGPAVSYRVVVSDPEDGRINPADVQVKLVHVPTKKTLAFSDKGVVLSPHQRGSTWIEESDCKGCHALNEQSVGPSFQAISKRYEPNKGNLSLVAQLTHKVLDGGKGVWGEANMSAHPQLSYEATSEMVQYILSLTDQQKERQLPAEGKFSTDQDPPGTYILTARYTDKGSRTARPLTSQASVILRSPVLTAPDFDEAYELQRREVITDVHKAAYVMARQIDLTAVTHIDFSIATETKGSSLEVRLDSPTGDLIGTLDVPKTGKWRDWKEMTLPIKATSGAHDLYFIARNRDYVMNLWEIKEVRFRKATP